MYGVEDKARGCLYPVAAMNVAYYLYYLLLVAFGMAVGMMHSMIVHHVALLFM
jgi:hypothetical protein